MAVYLVRLCTGTVGNSKFVLADEFAKFKIFECSEVGRLKFFKSSARSSDCVVDLFNTEAAGTVKFVRFV